MEDFDAILILQSQHIIPISLKVKNNILRKYHLLLRASIGNLHFHFVMYYLGEEMTTYFMVSHALHGLPKHSVPSLQSSRQKEKSSVPFPIDSLWKLEIQ